MNDLTFTLSMVSVHGAGGQRQTDQGSSINNSFPVVTDPSPIAWTKQHANPDDTMAREPKKLRTVTEKGALWHEYDILVHQIVAHLCHIHPANKDIMMETIPNTGKVLVTAADPLAKQGIPLYCTHSKTNR